MRLAAVDDAVLDALVAVATTDAAAGEVTPPLDGATGWTPARVAWLRAFHRTARTGEQRTWAVLGHDGAVVGSVRLATTEEPGVVETGIWLCRSARGRGLALEAVRAVLVEAGGATVVARTTAANRGALALLEALRFHVVEHDGAVTARRAPTADNTLS